MNGSRPTARRVCVRYRFRHFYPALSAPSLVPGRADPLGPRCARATEANPGERRMASKRKRLKSLRTRLDTRQDHYHKVV
jgi:hypothetical protein